MMVCVLALYSLVIRPDFIRPILVTHLVSTALPRITVFVRTLKRPIDYLFINATC